MVYIIHSMDMHLHVPAEGFLPHCVVRSFIFCDVCKIVHDTQNLVLFQCLLEELGPLVALHLLLLGVGRALPVSFVPV
jgi:hypothetical protein